MERKSAKVVEEVSRVDKVSPEMAFVAIVDTGSSRIKDDRSWQERGACTPADNEAFFLDVGSASAVREAKKICASCKVREVCLEDALERKELFGIWGGLTVKERRRLLALRRQGNNAA